MTPLTGYNTCHPYCLLHYIQQLLLRVPIIMASGMLHDFLGHFIMDALFRHGLSNSIYCPPHNIDVLGEDQVRPIHGCYGDVVSLY